MRTRISIILVSRRKNSSSKMSGSAKSTTTPSREAEGMLPIMNLKHTEWPTSLSHILNDPVVQQYVLLCPILGWIVLLDVDRFMDAVHRRYHKAGKFQQFKDSMTQQWGWIYFGRRASNTCYFVHQMGFGRGGFEWENHPRPEVIRQHRALYPLVPPAERAVCDGILVNPPTLPPLGKDELSYLLGKVSAQVQYCGQIEPSLKNWIQQRLQIVNQHVQQLQKNMFTIDAFTAMYMQHQENQLAQKKAGSVDVEVEEEDDLKIAADEVANANANTTFIDTAQAAGDAACPHPMVTPTSSVVSDPSDASNKDGAMEVEVIGKTNGGADEEEMDMDVDEKSAGAKAGGEGGEVSGASDGAAGGVEQIVTSSMFCTDVDAPFDDDQIAAI